MPEPNQTDKVLDNVVEVKIPVAEGGDSAMAAEVPSAIHEQILARLASAGARAHEHFITFGQILDLAYEQDRKMVSLVEALGVREVTSKSGQKGVPEAGAGS